MAMGGAPVGKVGEQPTHTTTREVTLGHCNFLGDHWSLLDCPDASKFAADTAAALSVVDFAVIVCEPASEHTQELKPVFKILEERSIPHLVFINKIDTLQTPLSDTLKVLQSYSSRPLVVRQMPIFEHDSVIGYIDVVKEQAYRYHDHAPIEQIQVPSSLEKSEDEARASLVEVLEHHDDGVPEQHRHHVKPTSEGLFRELHEELASDVIVEVLMGAADHGNGLLPLWKALRHDGPDPLSTAAKRGVRPDGEPLVQIFKIVDTVRDCELACGRIWRGSIEENGRLGGVKIAGLYRWPGGEASEIPEAQLGELVAFTLRDSVAPGMFLTPGGTDETFT